MSGPSPAIDRVRAQAYRVPTPAPEGDGTLAWDATTIVVVHAEAGPVRGLGWTYSDAACVPLIEGRLASAITGRPLADVPASWLAMQRAVRNLGRPGLVSCALSALDVALWDAAARWLELPLSRLLGRVHDEVDVYGSGGFTTLADDELAAQLDGWVHGQRIPASRSRSASHEYPHRPGPGARRARPQGDRRRRGAVRRRQRRLLDRPSRTAPRTAAGRGRHVVRRTCLE